MRVAITTWENRISPVADSARELLVVDVEGGRIIRRRHERFKDDSPFHRAERLSELSVTTFICGAISDFYRGLVEGYGIRLIPFVDGQVDEVLKGFLSDSLVNPNISRARPSAQCMKFTSFRKEQRGCGDQRKKINDARGGEYCHGKKHRQDEPG